MKSNIHDYDCVEDFFADESFQNYTLTSTDSKIWDKYIIKYPEKKAIIVEAQNLIQVFAVGSSKPGQSPTKTSIKSNRWIMSAAASLFIMIVAGIGLWMYKPVAKIAMTTTYADAGKMDLHLPDHSTITIREGSRIIHPDIHSNFDRKVRLEGEAFFDIAKDKDGKTFQIDLAKGRITVYGTKFLVASDAAITKIILQEGKISYHIGNKDYYMDAGDILLFDGKKLTLEKDANITLHDKWRASHLEFDNASLRHIANVLFESYGLTLEVSDTRLYERKITAKVAENDPQLLLEAIAAIYDLNLFHKNNKWILD